MVSSRMLKWHKVIRHCKKAAQYQQQQLLNYLTFAYNIFQRNLFLLACEQGERKERR